MAVPASLDHLVYSVPDLEAAVEDLASRLGVRPALGGRHPGRGTWNALLGLGARRYLEVIARDPSQPAPDGPLPHDLDGLRAPRLVTWAAAASDLEPRVAAARERGCDLGAVRPLRRTRPDGVELAWRLTGRPAQGEGLVPFLIDWGETPHPSADAPRGCELVDLRAVHPEPARIAAMLAAVGVELAVEAGERALVAEVASPRGRVRLA